MKTINLTKKVKDLNNENFKTLMKQIKDTKKMEKIFHVHGMKELLFVHITQSNVQINAIPVKILMVLHETNKNPQTHIEVQKNPNS